MLAHPATDVVFVPKETIT